MHPYNRLKEAATERGIALASDLGKAVLHPPQHIFPHDLYLQRGMPVQTEEERTAAKYREQGVLVFHNSSDPLLIPDARESVKDLFELIVETSNGSGQDHVETLLSLRTRVGNNGSISKVSHWNRYFPGREPEDTVSLGEYFAQKGYQVNASHH
ncbi:hypothetical protein J4460_06485 [Candidatus Woesearchaeota archaeon]|nr:MAG: hypothetical protein QS99_C0016G0075 [archaeon GW2011_AR4]MBS3130288.1 hypothetical protein [Candidatus Woesearchaeota archaeon]HIH37335.1 hypothetical protein [Candidatus Woesearchaeota archaeon]HIH48756.1 hypothetical protein [Candidatus Woesearchaeota archaeon]HIJ04150.1 hypothetical protein [Candidatus Woesearchaeota archaeon]